MLFRRFAPRSTEAEHTDFKVHGYSALTPTPASTPTSTPAPAPNQVQRVHGYSALVSEHVPFAVADHEAIGVYLGRDARSSALVAVALLGSRRAAVSEAEGGAGGEGGRPGEGVRWRLRLRGAPQRLRVAVVVGDGDGDGDGATTLAARAAALVRYSGADGAAARWATEREARWREAFTPGNARYSGHLPRLLTTDDALSRTYYHGVLALRMPHRPRTPD